MTQQENAPCAEREAGGASALDATSHQGSFDSVQNQVGNAEFTTAVFGAEAHCWITSFEVSPKDATPSDWKGRLCQAGAVPDFSGRNSYYSVASFKPGADGRTYANFEALQVVVLDDIRDVDLDPSYRLRTSPDKWQIGFRLKDPIDDLGVAKRLHTQLAKAGHIPNDKAGNNPIRLARLPIGSNTKHEPPFRCMLETWNPELVFTLDELIAGLKLDAEYILHGGQKEKPTGAVVGDVIPEGARNVTLTSRAGSMRRKGFSEGAINAALQVENTERCRPPLDEKDVATIARSIARYAPSEVPKDGAPESSQPEIRFDIQPLTLEALHTSIEPRKFAIEPLLPRGVLIELSGAHGISKSTLALDMALHVAAGRRWCGLPTTAGKVVFASREDSHEDILRRVQSLLSAFRPEDRPMIEKAICENLMFLGREDTKHLSVTMKEFGKCSVRREAIDIIAERCQGASLIVLETASRLHGGDELNEDLAQLAEAFEQIAGRTDAAVMLIRHVGKQAAKDKSVDSYAGRGGGSLSDAARSVLVLVQLDQEEAKKRHIILDGLAASVSRHVIVLTHAKSSYTEPHAPLYFVRLPGPQLKQVFPLDETNMYSERLLAFMRKEALKGGEAMSAHKLKERCGEAEVPQNKVADVLDRLHNEGRVMKEEIGGRGGKHTVWRVIKLTDLTDLKLS